jgi:hypothetical protein
MRKKEEKRIDDVELEKEAKAAKEEREEEALARDHCD